ncbi:unnamed protein product [Peronospora belbahrii]|uniref:Mannosylglycerate hydrolase MGH1-like glycoside hydrolase domain-containing protein n=1 Tax=Peronospora belbahrii TaxID=622444 RepID=A0AAU9L4N7_9STRA|nr:unnamed protein product [Peronospora belbahrii]
MDMEFGGVGAGTSDIVGFQYMKPGEALLAAQALAHEDFHQAAIQVQRILEYQKPDGLLPHLVYGPTVPSNLRWIPSNRTFHPGPAFWKNSSLMEHQEKEVVFDTSTISAPPVAADVAWEIFRLAPYDSVLGVKTTAVQFLCQIYQPLQRLQKHLFYSRRSSASSGLLTAHHPWETFSSLSPHWKGFLTTLKKAPDYEAVVSSIPEEARNRFAAGASTLFSAQDAVDNIHVSTVVEPIAYSAASGETVRFGVEDVEFNALMLRSSLGLENIGRVLADHSSVCNGFTLSKSDLLKDVIKLRAMSKGLKEALVGSNTTHGLWNTSVNFFADSSRVSLTATYSLRGFLPGYAVELDDEKKMRSMEHFLSKPSSFSFFCAQFPAVFFACSEEDLTTVAGSIDGRSAPTTWILYNYYVLRGFVRNKFPGLADYIRNKTRDMICEATVPTRPYFSWFRMSLAMEKPTPAALAAVYDSHNGAPVEVFDDAYLGSTLAAAAFLNILLPAVTPPPSPDTPPVDHRILSVIMCVELVVAFGVAMSCFLFSVYFVANRPRETRLSIGSTAHRRSSTEAARRNCSQDRSNRHRYDLEDRKRSSPNGLLSAENNSPYSDCSPRPGRVPNDLEEALLSGAGEHYGSFDEAEQPQSLSNFAWKAAKRVLASISPW